MSYEIKDKEMAIKSYFYNMKREMNRDISVFSLDNINDMSEKPYSSNVSGTIESPYQIAAGVETRQHYLKMLDDMVQNHVITDLAKQYIQSCYFDGNNIY